MPICFGTRIDGEGGILCSSCQAQNFESGGRAALDSGQDEGAKRLPNK